MILFASAGQMPDVAKAHEPAPFLIPQSEGERLKAREQRDRGHLLKERIGPMTAFQMVVRNAGTQMVDVVEADVAREPLEDFRELVEGTALQRRRRVIPIIAALP